MVYEFTIMNVLLELFHKRLVDAGVNCLGHMPIPRTERVFHKHAEYFSDAEIWQVKEEVRFT